MLTSPNPHPGHALRTARIDQGLSLRALAARTGLPFSTLSKLENGKMGMSYDKLCILSQGLGLDLSDLVAAPTPADEPAAALGRRSVSLADQRPEASSERHSHYYPAADLLGKMMVPVVIDVKARSVEEMGGLVRHAGEEYLYVLTGAMELHSDLYAPLPLHQGDSVYFDSGMAHAYILAGTAPCQVLSVCAGPSIRRLAGSAGQSWNLVPSQTRP